MSSQLPKVNGFKLLFDEASDIRVGVLRIEKVIAAHTFRQDFPYPGVFIDNVRSLRDAIKPLTLGSWNFRYDAETWCLAEQACEIALRTVESYRPPGYQGNPIALFNGSGMDFLEKLPQVIQNIQMKVMACNRAAKAHEQEPAPISTHSRQRVRA